MAMRPKLNLSWKGKEYPLIVTMDTIDRLEDKINLTLMVQRCSEGDIRFSHASKMIALLLSEAGADVTQEEVYDGLFNGGSVTASEVGILMGDIFSVIFPQPKKKLLVSKKGKRSTKAKH